MLPVSMLFFTIQPSFFAVRCKSLGPSILSVLPLADVTTRLQLASPAA